MRNAENEHQIYSACASWVGKSHVPTLPWHPWTRFRFLHVNAEAKARLSIVPIPRTSQSAKSSIGYLKVVYLSATKKSVWSKSAQFIQETRDLSILTFNWPQTGLVWTRNVNNNLCFRSTTTHSTIPLLLYRLVFPKENF